MLDALVADIRRGESWSLVLRGEAGVGKTVLLEYPIASAPELSAVRVVGAESEMELAYSGLHQLCSISLRDCPIRSGSHWRSCSA
jgi:ABC-type molybdenum transport system ATPase subunit/photorepair protein PhrA